MFRFAAVFVALLAIATAVPINDLDAILRQATNETIEPSATPAPQGTPTVSAQPTQTAKAAKPAPQTNNNNGENKEPAPQTNNNNGENKEPAPAPAPGASTGNQVAPSPSASASPEMTEESMEPQNTAPPCFPAAATVQLESGLVKKMADLVVGDRVNVGNGQFSEVYMFTHKMASVKYSFVELKTASGATLRLTDGHYLPVNGQYVPAKRANVGDNLILADGSVSNIVEIASVKDTGLFNPQTTHGDIVVDGIQASTYTTAVEPNMAHALLAPLRTICNRFGMQVRFLESGYDAIRGGIASISA